VPCPIDPSHTVFADQVKHHVKVCTGAKQKAASLQQPYFSAGLNGGAVDHAASSDAVAPAAALSLSRDDDVTFYRQIEALYTTHIGSVRQMHLKADECDGLMKAASTAGAEHATYRHLVQQASIVGNMERVGILQPSGGESTSTHPVFVEFGAGRGMLSLAIREAVPSAPLLLVERGSVRNKADNQLRKQEKAAGAAFERIRVDIRDFDMCRAPMLVQASAASGCTNGAAHCVAVSKHLCGVATDLTLRCLLNATRAPDGDVATAAAAAAAGEQKEIVETPLCSPCAPPTASENAPRSALSGSAAAAAQVRVDGVAIALCCHHCMNWDDFVGRQFFAETLGLGREGFDAIKGSVSWCTEACGPKGGLSAEQRAICGRRCKRLLDLGRLDWLRRMAGMEAELVEYCDPATSLENALLLGWRSQASAMGS
jgi:tRNA:m4X modification enzyme